MVGTAALAATPALRQLGAYRIVSRLYFHLPILLVFFLQQGSSTFTAEVLLAIYGVAVTAGSLLAPPVLAALQLRCVLAAAELAKAAGLIAITTGDTALLVVGQALSGVGFAVAMAAEGQILPALCADATERARFQSATQSLMFVAVFIAGVAGAAMYSVDQRLPLLGAALAAVGAGIVAGGLRAGSNGRAPAAGAAEASAGARGNGVRWWSAYYVVVRAVALATFVGFLPVLFFQLLHVRLLLFGAILGVFSIAAFVGARYADRLRERLSAYGLAFATLGLTIACLLVFGVTSALGPCLLAMFALGGAAGLVRPLTMVSLAAAPDLGGTARRMELAFGVSNAALLVAGGALLTVASLSSLMLILAAALLLAAAGLAIAAARSPRTAPLVQGA